MKRQFPWRLATFILAGTTLLALVVPHLPSAFAGGQPSKRRSRSAAEAAPDSLRALLRRPLRVTAGQPGVSEDELIAVIETEPSAALVQDALDRLAVIGTDRALEPLVGLASDPRVGLAVAAVGTMGAIGGDAATRALIAQSRSARYAVRRAAVDALGKAGTTEAYEALAAIVRDVRHPHRLSALVAVTEMDDPRTVDLVREALPTLSVYVVADVAGMLAESPAPGAAELLEELSDHPNARIAEIALSASCRANADGCVPRLLEMLSSGDGMIAHDAARTLADLGAVEAVPALLEIARSGSATARRAAAMALSSLAGPGDAEALEGLLRDGDPSVAMFLAEAMADDGDPHTIEVLLRVARTGSRPARSAAINALQAIGGEAVDALNVEIARAGRVDERMEALRYLVQTSHPQAADIVLEWVQGGGRMADSAVAMLGQAGSASATDVLRRIADEGTSRARVYALTALANAAPDDPGLVDRLTEVLIDGPADHASLVTSSLVELGTPAARESLRRALREGSPMVAQMAAMQLGQVADAEDAAALVEAARSGPPSVKASALQALVAARSPEADQLLEDAVLRNDSPRAAAAALMSISDYNMSDEARALLRRAVRADSDEVRAAAIGPLVRDGGEDGLRLAREMVQDRSSEVRSAALSALSEASTPEAARAILDVAERGEPELRAQALRYAAMSGDPRAEDVLLRAVRDDDTSVATAAVDALGETGGENVASVLTSFLGDDEAPRELRLAAARSLQRCGGRVARDNEARIRELLGADEEGGGYYGIAFD